MRTRFGDGVTCNEGDGWTLLIGSRNPRVARTVVLGKYGLSKLSVLKPVCKYACWEGDIGRQDPLGEGGLENED